MTGEDTFEVTIRNYFLDASAIVKLVCDEAGSEKVRALKRDPGRIVFRTSWVPLAEALGALKGKWKRQELSPDEYEAAVKLLFLHIRSRDLEPVDISIVNGEARLATYEQHLSEMRSRYPKLDAADALQLTVIRQSFLRHFAGESRARLVSADRDLLAAAAGENIEVVSVIDDD